MSCDHASFRKESMSKNGGKGMIIDLGERSQ